MKLILFLLLIVVFSSCVKYKAKQLETGTVMYINSDYQYSEYTAGDSVWVDSTNTINPQATNAMLCVILK